MYKPWFDQPAPHVLIPVYVLWSSADCIEVHALTDLLLSSKSSVINSSIAV
jgi:hypothetical protein